MADRVSHRPRLHRLTLLSCVAALALTLGACKKDGPDVTSSISKPQSPDAWRSYTEEWGRRYDARPGEKVASINFAQGLRMVGQREQAAAVLETAALKAPRDRDVLAAYGKALIEVGKLDQADEVLSRAHTPDRPDWRILSAQGAIADQLGDHAKAQNLYQSALRLQPQAHSVMANLGLSYALSKRLPEAESTLRQAAEMQGADSRVRQNLALVLGLQGKFAEAESMARRDLPPVEAAQSVAAMKQMVAQPNTWAKIRAADAAPRSNVAKSPTDRTQAAKVEKTRPPATAAASADQPPTN